MRPKECWPFCSIHLRGPPYPRKPRPFLTAASLPIGDRRPARARSGGSHENRHRAYLWSRGRRCDYERAGRRRSVLPVKSLGRPPRWLQTSEKAAVGLSFQLAEFYCATVPVANTPYGMIGLGSWRVRWSPSAGQESGFAKRDSPPIGRPRSRTGSCSAYIALSAQ